MILRQLLTLVLFLVGFSQANAQILSVESPENTYLTNLRESDQKIFLVDVEDYLDWTFFVNAEEKTLFIDFEEIDGKTEKIQIVKDDAVKFMDDLSRFSSSTFYELSLKDFEGGFYTILIETNNQVLVKEFIIEN